METEFIDEGYGRETAVSRRLRQHARRHELVGRTAAMVFGELRDPLTVIRGYAELIGRDPALWDDRRFQGLMRGVEHFGAVMECALSLMCEANARESVADVARSISLVRDLVMITRHPRPRIEIDVAAGLLHAQIAPSDLEQVLTNLLIALAGYDGESAALTIAARDIASPPPQPMWSPFIASTTLGDQWDDRWIDYGAAVSIRIENRRGYLSPETLRFLFAEAERRDEHNLTVAALVTCRDLLDTWDSTLIVESARGRGIATTVIIPAVRVPNTPRKEGQAEQSDVT